MSEVSETVLVRDGRPLELHPAFDRLRDAAARAGLPEPPFDELQALAHEALVAAGEPDCVLRLVWTGETGSAVVSGYPEAS
jgi:branched-subunit amino acid aminotransferase/4-amino-4-deoxychorismate lyase